MVVNLDPAGSVNIFFSVMYNSFDDILLRFFILYFCFWFVVHDKVYSWSNEMPCMLKLVNIN